MNIVQNRKILPKGIMHFGVAQLPQEDGGRRRLICLFVVVSAEGRSLYLAAARKLAGKYPINRNFAV
jgi:hypothetical protein